MSKVDENYHILLEKILHKGYLYDDPNRKGVKRIEIPSYIFRHEFKDGFPAITTKKLNYKNVVTELLWFLKGDTNIKYLIDNGCNIWNKDAYNYSVKYGMPKDFGMENFIENVKKGAHTAIHKDGDLDRVYGYYWRNLDGVDQISDLIKGLREKPLGTEHIVTARNPIDKDYQALPCCHYGFQIVVRPLEYDFENMSEECDMHFTKEYNKYSDGDSSSEDFWNQGWYKYAYERYPQYGFELHWNQRSVDTFLGLPYNIASYATLALIIEKITGYKALAIQGDLKKVHLYDNSLDAIKEQLRRDIDKYNKCELKFDRIYDTLIKDIDYDKLSVNDIIESLFIEDFQLENYESYPHIKVEMLERDE